MSIKSKLLTEGRNLLHEPASTKAIAQESRLAAQFDAADASSVMVEWMEEFLSAQERLCISVVEVSKCLMNMTSSSATASTGMDAKLESSIQAQARLFESGKGIARARMADAQSNTRTCVEVLKANAEVEKAFASHKRAVAEKRAALEECEKNVFRCLDNTAACTAAELTEWMNMLKQARVDYEQVLESTAQVIDDVQTYQHQNKVIGFHFLAEVAPVGFRLMSEAAQHVGLPLTVQGPEDGATANIGTSENSWAVANMQQEAQGDTPLASHQKRLTPDMASIVASALDNAETAKFRVMIQSVQRQLREAMKNNANNGNNPVASSSVTTNAYQSILFHKRDNSASYSKAAVSCSAASMVITGSLSEMGPNVNDNEFKTEVLNANGTSTMAHFEHVKTLGAGTYGSTSLKKDFRNGSQVVIKRVRCQDMVEVNKACNEGVMLSFFKACPSIVGFREMFLDQQESSEVGVTDLYVNIVMDYCNSGDMSHALQKARESQMRFSEEQVVHWVGQLASGLKIIHAKQIIHRDIKPANLFVHNGDVRIGDFGVAFAMQSDDQKATDRMGTSAYMAPEVDVQRPYGFPADIWSLGCVLYELVTLRKTDDFGEDGERAAEAVNKNVDKKLYSPAMVNLLKALLDKDPLNRLTATAIAQYAATKF